MANLTKRDAVKIYRAEIFPTIPANDRPAQRAAWNDFVDHLCRVGQISQRQAYNWDQPAFIKKEL